MKYRVNEVFRTIQGEAKFTGTPCIFIRLQGCGVGCAWCDTKHTWESPQDQQVDSIIAKTGDSPTWSMMSTEEIINYAEASGVHHVVLTGGEPFEQDIVPLIHELNDNNFDVQVETSGTVVFPYDCGAWVTVSPKFNMPGGKKVLDECLIYADELKMPVGKQSDIDKAEQVSRMSQAKMWLQPLSQSKKVTQQCVEACHLLGFNLSIQTHKFIGVR